MHRLAANEYHRVIPLLVNIPFNVHFAKSVLADKVDGLVLVDDIASPQTVYIRHSYGMSLLCGDTTNAGFNRQLLTFLQDDRTCINPEYLQIYPLEWSSVLVGFFADKLQSCTAHAESLQQAAVVEHVRVNFEFVYERYLQAGAAIDLEQYDLRRLDADSALNLVGLVVPRYFWRDVDKYELFGDAYGLYIDQELAAVSFASCRDDEILELGIETSEKFRGQGFAQIVCLKLIAETLKLGLVPVWACRKGNTGSYKLAHKVGFVAASEWPYYQIIRR